MKESDNGVTALLRYRGYAGSLSYSPEDGLYVGKILNAKDMLYFHGKTVKEAEENFRDCVEEYIDWQKTK
ncbi:MAG: antitoxin HicB [Clostridiales bacterium]|nr:antitoxin HicB [Clostridiales bacterium]